MPGGERARVDGIQGMDRWVRDERTRAMREVLDEERQGVRTERRQRGQQRQGERPQDTQALRRADGERERDPDGAELVDRPEPYSRVIEGGDAVRRHPDDDPSV